jgi:hypothetical protein
MLLVLPPGTTIPGERKAYATYDPTRVIPFPIIAPANCAFQTKLTENSQFESPNPLYMM